MGEDRRENIRGVERENGRGELREQNSIGPSTRENRRRQEEEELGWVRSVRQREEGVRNEDSVQF
jgi:hypothetical protein